MRDKSPANDEHHLVAIFRGHHVDTRAGACWATAHRDLERAYLGGSAERNPMVVELLDQLGLEEEHPSVLVRMSRLIRHATLGCRPQVVRQTPGGGPGLLDRLRHLLLGCDMGPHFIVHDGRLIRLGEVCSICGEERP